MRFWGQLVADGGRQTWLVEAASELETLERFAHRCPPSFFHNVSIRLHRCAVCGLFSAPTARAEMATAFAVDPLPNRRGHRPTSSLAECGQQRLWLTLMATMNLCKSGGFSRSTALSSAVNGGHVSLLMELSTRETRRAVVERLHTLDVWQQYLSGRHGVDTPEAQRRLLRDAIQRARTPPAKDGRKYADSHYRDVARLYLDLLDHGHGRATIVQLARQLNVSPTTARNWVHRPTTRLPQRRPARTRRRQPRPPPPALRPAPRAPAFAVTRRSACLSNDRGRERAVLARTGRRWMSTSPSSRNCSHRRRSPKPSVRRPCVAPSLVRGMRQIRAGRRE